MKMDCASPPSCSSRASRRCSTSSCWFPLCWARDWALRTPSWSFSVKRLKSIIPSTLRRVYHMSASEYNNLSVSLSSLFRPPCRVQSSLLMKVLDVGCGINKKPGSIGIDRNPNTKADVLVELDRFPYPFRDKAFDGLQAVHVIEHVSDVIKAMEEFHRIVRPGGEVFIVTPHYTDFSSFCDPTHRWHLNSFS